MDPTYEIIFAIFKRLKRHHIVAGFFQLPCLLPVQRQRNAADKRRFE